jgi:lipoprotein
MKPYFSWKTLCLLLCLALLAGCSDDDEQPDPQLPPLVWPDDVATAIPDEGFREYCLERYDRDKDGRLSKDEVLAVTSMTNYTTRYIRSFEGIEYFRNLETLYWGECDVPSLDLRYNARLEKVRFSCPTKMTCLRGPIGNAPLAIEFLFSCNLEELDLSGCGNVQELLTSAAVLEEVTLTSVDLPDPSHLQYLNIAAANAGCYDTLLAGAVNLKELYCNFYPDAVLDLSGCPKLESLTVLTFAESALAKIRLRKGLSQLRELKIYDENNKDYSHLVEIEYVE